MNLTEYFLFDLIDESEKLSFSQAIIKSNPDKTPEEPKTAQYAGQLLKVYTVMRDGKWRTLAQIAFEAKAPEASVSARIRDLANEKGIPHEKRKAREGSLYEYRLLISSEGTSGDEPQ